MDNRLLQYEYYNKAPNNDKLAITCAIHIVEELHRKFTKSYNRGQKNIISDQKAKAYRMVKDTERPTDALMYLMLFRSPDSIIKNPSEEVFSIKCSFFVTMFVIVYDFSVNYHT